MGLIQRLAGMPRRRLLTVLLLAALLAPGTWLRSRVSDRYVTEVTIAALPFNGRQHGLLRVRGLWQLRGAGENFGGYSAMLLHGDQAIRLFSDRGYLLTIVRPGAGPGSTLPFTTRQLYPVGLPLIDLLDIESVTHDPATGQYWVGYENHHTIYRYRVSGEPEAFVEPAFARDWYENGGIEAMVRLADGRFVVFQEGAANYYLYSGDPTEGAQAERGTVIWPHGFSVTDAAQLPDGRLVAVVRRVALHVPPFEAMLVLLDRPPMDRQQTWRARPLASLDSLVARDNWEALAVEPGADGAVDLWLAADDNRSLLQRSLVAQLAFTPPPIESGQ